MNSDVLYRELTHVQIIYKYVFFFKFKICQYKRLQLQSLLATPSRNSHLLTPAQHASRCNCGFNAVTAASSSDRRVEA